MNNKPTARQLAFEYLRRLSEELSPTDYLKKFEQLESEFSTLLHSSCSNDKTTGLCEFLSRFCPKCKADGQRGNR
ncbi:YdiH family protein [Symbiopectobacterium sp. Eva_TO]